MESKFFIHFCLLMILLTFLNRPEIAAVESSVELSEDERAWIEAHGPLRVSNELNWAPFNFNERGTAAGYSIDTMILIAENLDIEIEFVSGPEWNEFIEMLHLGEIDVMLNIAKTAQREESMLFTSPYSQFSLSLFTRTETARIDSFANLSGMTIAVPKGFWLEEILHGYPDINILHVNDTEEAILAVSSGLADALYDVMPVVQYLSKRLFITNLKTGGTLNLDGSEKVELHLAVDKDQEMLLRILNKGISSISAGDFTKLRNKWLDSRLIETVPSQKISMNIRFPILVILGSFLLMFFLSYLLRRIISKKVKILNFHSIWLISMIGLTIFIALVVFFGWITIHKTSESLKEDLYNSMNVVLDTTEQSLYVWIDNNLQMVKRDSGNKTLRGLTEGLLKDETDLDEQKDQFRSYINGSLRWLDEEMYQIIDVDYRILLSNESDLEGTVSAIGLQAENRIERAFSGETIFIPTFNTALGAELITPKMFYISPIRDKKGKIVAVLARSDDPYLDFNRLVTMGHSGKTGETYAFNSTGSMISKSRFENQLYQMGLLGRKESSILHIQLKNPGRNLIESRSLPPEPSQLDFTYMASQALAGIRSNSISEYRDYRGVPVFGVWHWDERHEFGLATEIDIEEGLESFYVIRNSTILTLTMTVFLAVLVTLMSLRFSEKSNQALNESRSDLEERVNLRTLELSEANKNLNNTIEALTHPFYVIDTKSYKILLANKAARQLGNEKGAVCYSLMYQRDTPCEGIDNRCPIAEVLKTKRPIQVEHIQRDQDGNERFIEVNGYPILDETGEVVQMIEYSLDITDRRIAEEMTKKHLEELELFNKLTIGREEKMIDLKEEINKLLALLNLPEKYTIVTGDEESDFIDSEDKAL